METVEAWILRGGPRGEPVRGQLELAIVELPSLGSEEVLVEPLYGCWEGNMTSALNRSPVDVCRLRREEFVVLGNAGVVRVLKRGADVRDCHEGDVAVVVPNGTTDRYGHTIRVLGYDQPGRLGLLAKRTVLHQSQIQVFRSSSRFSLVQWAGFPVRYTTAWENWAAAYSTWRNQYDEPPAAHVWGWGGGVTFAELQLARSAGCQVAMCSSKPERLATLAEHGIIPIDRREFAELEFDETHYETDRAFRTAYLAAERRFLEKVRTSTEGEGVAIFIDNIGFPVFRATLRALSRLGVVTTAGWKLDKRLSYDRAGACVQRHTLVHTHGSRRSAGLDAFHFAERTGWLPPAGAEVYGWHDVPRLADDAAAERVASYFPVFAVNEV